MPALFFERAVPRGEHQLAFRRLLAFGGIQDGEVLAQDIFAPVAVERLGPGVPARHTALRIEHVDRAVLDRIDDEPRALLALAQGLFDLAACLDVFEQAGVGRRESARAAACGLEEERAQAQECGQRSAEGQRSLG